MKLLRMYATDFGKMFFILLFFASLPFWISRIGFYQYIGVEILIWCTYAMAFNLALGYTGLPSFGHGAFLGVGAYAMAIYQLNFAGQSLWIGLFFALLFGAIAGGLVALFLSHRRGIYFALMTVAFGQVFWFITIKWRSLTKGEDGLLNLQRLPAEFGVFSLNLDENFSYYFFALAVFALTLIVLWILIHSPFGHILQALKQNEMRTRFIGYDVRVFKWISFTISAGISGLAGGMFALAQQSAFPDVMNLQWSGIIVMMVIIGGGLVSFWGPIVGTIFYFIARDLLGTYTETWMLWFGLTFMLIILFQPEGLVGIWRKVWGGINSKYFQSAATGQEAPLPDSSLQQIK